MRITLKSFSVLSYNCTDEHQQLLLEVNAQLNSLMGMFKSKLPQDEGILLRPELRKKLKLSRQKKIALSRASQLKLPPSRGEKEVMLHTETELEKERKH